MGRMLIEKNVTISCAESCTGGMFAGRLTDISGISKVFNRGLVTYTNEAKMEELGVSADTLETFGAVSEQTAMEMAAGLYKKTGSDICISVTGEAGPTSSEGKPVGTIFIGVCWNGSIWAVKIPERNKGRKWNRSYAVLHMFNEVYEVLKKL